MILQIYRAKWSVEETILALDYYLTHKGRIPFLKGADLRDLTEVIQQYNSHFSDGNVRSQASIEMKISNFKSIDSEPINGSKGLSQYSLLDYELFMHYRNRINDLEEAVSQIKASMSNTSGRSLPSIKQTTEGGYKLVTHKIIERNPNFIKKFKLAMLDIEGKLSCSVCEFDFEDFYGDIGHSFIECHHLIPISKYEGPHAINKDDLALVCSNCHSMLHKSLAITIDELRMIVKQTRNTNYPM